MYNCKYLQEVVMHKCFGATIVLGMPLIYYKTLGTAFVAILKHLFYIETGIFSCKIFAVYGMENWPGRHKGSLDSGKTLVLPISSQNLIHTDIELG